MTIYEQLSCGEKNARTAQEIAKTTGLCVRDVMQAIRRERLDGKPICSTCKGYFIAGTTEELKGTIIRLYKQAKETKRVADAIKEHNKLTAQDISNQERREK